MGRISTIDLLPQEVLDAINGCLAANMTLDDVVVEVKKLGEKISRSAIGRHKLKFDEMMDRVKQSRVMAETMVKELGDAGESKVARLNIEILQTALLKISLDKGDELDVKEIALLSKASEALAKARKIDQDTIIEAGQIMQKKAAAAVDKAAVNMGMTKDTRDKFNSIIFGIDA